MEPCLDAEESLASKASVCFEDPSACPQTLTECFSNERSECAGEIVSSRYDNASAAWVVYCAILMFFMKAGFLYLEQAFCDSAEQKKRAVLAKYVDIFAGTFGFWLFGYAISGNTDAAALGEEQDFVFWFFRFTFASNTATILGGTLVGQEVLLRTSSVFVYSFVMTAFIHPGLALLFWSTKTKTWSPYSFCNGTFTATRSHNFTIHDREYTGFNQFTFIDFAGSGIVHLCGGMGGLVLAMFHKLEKKFAWKYQEECNKNSTSSSVCFGLLRKRPSNTEDSEDAPNNNEQTKGCGRCMRKFLKGWLKKTYPKNEGSNVVADSAALAIIILWTTWFAFNAGSIESISGKRVHAAVGRLSLVMCLSCASAGIIQVVVCTVIQASLGHKSVNTNEIANVILAALVAVTGCCPFIDPLFAILIGVLTVVWYHAGSFLEHALGLYDGAGVFPVHGMCGFWGVLCVGIFSRSCLIREVYENLCFCVFNTLPDSIDNLGLLFLYQLAGGLFIAVWAFVLCSATFCIMWLIPITCLPKVILSFFEKRKMVYTGNLLFTECDVSDEPSFGEDVAESAGEEDVEEGREMERKADFDDQTLSREGSV